MATRAAGSAASSSALVSTPRRSKTPLARRASPPAATSPLASAASSGSAGLSALTGPRLRLVPARTGDHPAIHAFLLSVFQGPSALEFHAQLDEPGYLPADRLVVKHADDIVAHIRLARQVIRAGRSELATARFMDLATAAELRRRGLATALLTAGERAAAERGILLGIARTRCPALFARRGWSHFGGQPRATSSPRAILAELAAIRGERCEQSGTTNFFPPAEQSITVRPLRRIELPGIARLYEARSRGQFGWPVRDESYWEWLLARGACDRLYVAATTPQSPTIDALIESIVGYACVRQARIVELLTADGQSLVAEHLLERICADARESDGWTIRYDAPRDDALHALFVQAGGRLAAESTPGGRDGSGGEVCMVKLFGHLRALRALSSELHHQAQLAGIESGAELGIDLRTNVRTDNLRPDKLAAKKHPLAGVIERYRMRFAKHQVEISTGGPSRHSISLSANCLAPLLLGEASARDLANSGHLISATPKAMQIANRLFPGKRWWRPILDDLLA